MIVQFNPVHTKFLEFMRIDPYTKYAQNIHLLLQNYDRGEYGNNAKVWKHVQWSKEFRKIGELRGISGETSIKQAQYIGTVLERELADFRSLKIGRSIPAIATFMLGKYEDFKKSL
jgi:hypothetical protein